MAPEDFARSTSRHTLLLLALLPVFSALLANKRVDYYCDRPHKLVHLN